MGGLNQQLSLSMNINGFDVSLQINTLHYDRTDSIDNESNMVILSFCKDVLHCYLDLLLTALS